MKTITKNDDVRRVSDEEADKLVSNSNWKYCPKSMAKKGKKVAAPVVAKVDKAVEEPKVKKGKGGSAAAEAKYREKKASKN